MERTILSSLIGFYNSYVAQDVVYEIADTVSNLIDNRGDTRLIIGVCEEYMEKFDNGNLFFAIPSAYPVRHWPKIRPFKTVVVEETAFPFLPNTFETIILIHFLEFSKKTRDSLKDIFRILKPNGNLIIISVNKNSRTIPREHKMLKNNVKHGVNELIRYLFDASFSVFCAAGFKNGVKFWPYNFNYRFNKYNSIFIPFLPFLSDIVVLASKKNEEAKEAIRILDTQYETL